MFIYNVSHVICTRLASLDILGEKREPRVGELGWHGNFDTGFERNIFRQKSSVFFLFFSDMLKKMKTVNLEEKVTEKIKIMNC